jgi:hypothetical protein
VLEGEAVQLAPLPRLGVLAQLAGQLEPGLDEGLAQDLVLALGDVRRELVVPPGALRVAEQLLHGRPPPVAAVGLEAGR